MHSQRDLGLLRLLAQLRHEAEGGAGVEPVLLLHQHGDIVHDLLVEGRSTHPFQGAGLEQAHRGILAGQHRG